MYIPIARRYRPVNFDKIIGQDHITRTLKNAIQSNRVAHAYLFTGPRGIGKTSTARVLAKALNCAGGLTINPCGKCSSCMEIAKGTNLDVLEIDGASNRGIDEIRNLRENVKLKPISGRCRIYIIDEIHMLTPEAFNALLKTLEEPPAHVKFIFATTRPYKILPTIISRCQRFDFRLIPSKTIISHLRSITEKEKINIDDDALLLITKHSGGSLRDAQIMLDQITSFTKGKVKSQDVKDMLGCIEEDMLIALSRAILSKDGSSILELINELINSGKDPLFICTTLIRHFRNLIVIAACKDPNEFVLAEEALIVKLKDLSGKFDQEELFYIIYTLTHALDLIGRTSLGRVPLEISLLKLARRKKALPVKEALERLKKIESSMKSGIITQDKILGEPKRDIPERGVSLKENNVSKVSNHNDAADNTGDVSLQRIKGIWPEVVRMVRAKKVSTGVYLEESEIVRLNEDKLILGFTKSNSLHKEALEARQNKDLISQTIKDLTDKTFQVELIFIESNGQDEKTAAKNEPGMDTQRYSAAGKIEPIIKTAVDKFSGKIIKQF